MGFPPNSFSSKDEPEPEKQEDKNITPVAEGKKRKKPLGKRITSLFIGGSAKSASDYVVFDVMIPAAKDLIVEASAALVERVIFGESRRSGRRGATPPVGGPTGYVSYNRYSMAPQQPEAPRMSRRARAAHDFDEIVLASRPEAEGVLEQWVEIISKYGVATVADLYKMVNVASTHVDTTWGWTDARNAGVMKVRGGGFMLDLPEPIHL